MTNRQSIKDFIASRPEGQFAPGLYVVKVGRDYVNYISVWYKTTKERMTIDAFYQEYYKEI